MDERALAMKEIQSLKELGNGAPDEIFIKSIWSEYNSHIAQTHLRSLKDEDNMATVRTSGFKEVQQSADVASPLMRSSVSYQAGNMVVRLKLAVN
jgi:hypothetical protein